MTVAILLPVYNEEKYLRECLDSIKQQTYKNFHCFILDDGSTDNSSNIIKEYLTDTRFHYYSYKHEGLAKTLNKGMNLCRGYEMISRMDADDVMFKERLKIQLDYLRENPNIKIIASTITYSINDFDSEKSNEVLLTPEEVFFKLKTTNVINHPTVSFRGDFLSEIKYPNVMLGEDLALWHNIVTSTNTVVLKKPLVLYRKKKRQFISFKDKFDLKFKKIKKDESLLVFSIIEYLNPISLGIEKTLSYRSKHLVNLNAIPYTIITRPLVLPNLRYHFEKHLDFREDSTIVIPNLISDIGMDWCTYTIEDYLRDNDVLKLEVEAHDRYIATLEDGREILNVRNEVVVQSLFINRGESNPSLFKLYSSKLYLIKKYEDNSLTYLNKDGSTALFINSNGDWFQNGESTSATELLLDFLLKYSYHKTIIIRDKFNFKYPALREYAKTKQIPYIGYLHYSPKTVEGELVSSVKTADYDVIVSCSNYMIPDIKTDKNTPIYYIPPVFVIETNHKKIGKKFLMITSSFSGKRVNELCEWFSLLGDSVHLDVYGSLNNTKEYSNISFKQYVKSEDINWSEYIGYISHSKAEAFSIALVEAIANGCQPIVYDSYYAHKHLTNNRYNSFEEFKSLIENAKSIKSRSLVNFENYLECYQAFLQNTIKENN